jgi:hypothetical protein
MDETDYRYLVASVGDLGVLVDGEDGFCFSLLAFLSLIDLSSFPFHVSWSNCLGKVLVETMRGGISIQMDSLMTPPLTVQEIELEWKRAQCALDIYHLSE